MDNGSTCPAVERDPQKMSGVWVFRGTRVPVSALFENPEMAHRFLISWRGSLAYPFSRLAPSWNMQRTHWRRLIELRISNRKSMAKEVRMRRYRTKGVFGTAAGAGEAAQGVV